MDWECGNCWAGWRAGRWDGCEVLRGCRGGRDDECSESRIYVLVVDEGVRGAVVGEEV